MLHLIFSKNGCIFSDCKSTFVKRIYPTGFVILKWMRGSKCYSGFSFCSGAPPKARRRTRLIIHVGGNNSTENCSRTPWSTDKFRIFRYPLPPVFEHFGQPGIEFQTSLLPQKLDRVRVVIPIKGESSEGIFQRE